MIATVLLAVRQLEVTGDRFSRSHQSRTKRGPVGPQACDLRAVFFVMA